MKLVAFLVRRLENTELPFPQGELHRWIRTGQVRVNSGRSTPFARLQEGDVVRIPPFASASIRHSESRIIPLETGIALGPGLTLIAVTPAILALNKPAGLPSQSGTGHDDSVAARLRQYFAGTPYIPAPAHRLDKNTSGVLLAGRSFEAQRHLHERFSLPGAGLDAGVTKTYLTWVKGLWPESGQTTLEDYLDKGAGSEKPVREVVRVVSEGEGRYARCLVSPLHYLHKSPCGPASLLCILLHTGRTHQIRVQLASRGYPILGDTKYGGKACSRMLLHAHDITVPMHDEVLHFSCLPDWQAPFAVTAESV